MTLKDMHKLKEELNDNALEIAKVLGFELDYSHKSIKKVERILGKVHKEYKKTGDDDGLRGVAISFAAYIINVIERNTIRGTWKRDHPKMGEDTFPFEWKDTTIFPFAWCMKRILDGKGDDVWSKYKVLVMERIKE